MHLAKFLTTESGKYLMSAILGFGLATLFRFSCSGKNCLILKAPSMEEVKDKIFKHDGQCYTYQAVTQRCDKTQEIVSA
jgi:hypothetical protein